jgi:hypothetical protein
MPESASLFPKRLALRRRWHYRCASSCLPFSASRSVLGDSPLVQTPPVATQSSTAPSSGTKPLPFGISSTPSELHRVQYSRRLASVHTCRPVSCQATRPAPPSQLWPRSASLSATGSAPSPYLHCPTMGIWTCPVRTVAQLSPDHYRKHQKQLEEKGTVTKNYINFT